MQPAKKIFLFVCFVFLASFLSAQESVSLDSIQLKTLKGRLIPYAGLAGKTPLVLICFWSVNSDASINELNAISKQYDKWKQQASFKLIAVCVDQGNLLSGMRTMVNMNEWGGFDVCADINGDLQKALHFNTLPESMILKDGQILYQQSGFQAGTENYLFSRIRSLAAGK